MVSTGVSLAEREADPAARTKRAYQGEPEALNALANAYANGHGLPQSYDDAIRLYQLAADRGLASAQFNLGLLSELGRGVSPDVAIAFKFYLKAAKNGFAPAQFNVGNMLANGIGTGQDLFEAMLWFRQAAERGLPEAQYNVGLAYEQGRGVRQNESLALEWYRTAAGHGYARAQFNLASMLIDGRGSPPNPTSALSLYRASATQNFAPAQYRLGILLAEGRVQPTNLVESYKWLALAVESGFPPQFRDTVATRLSQEQLREANLSLEAIRTLHSQTTFATNPIAETRLQSFAPAKDTISLHSAGRDTAVATGENKPGSFTRLSHNSPGSPLSPPIRPQNPDQMAFAEGPQKVAPGALTLLESSVRS